MNSTGKRALAIGLAAFALAVLAFAASAEDMGMEGMCEGCMRGKMGGMDMPMAKGLDLTAEQMEKLKANKLATAKQNIQDEAELKMIHLDIMAEAAKDKPDLGMIERLTQKAGGLKGKMMLATIKHKVFFRSLLTPEQKKKMEHMMMDMGGGMGGGHKMMEMKK